MINSSPSCSIKIQMKFAGTAVIDVPSDEQIKSEGGDLEYL